MGLNSGGSHNEYKTEWLHGWSRFVDSMRRCRRSSDNIVERNNIHDNIIRIDHDSYRWRNDVINCIRNFTIDQFDSGSSIQFFRI